MDTLRFRNCLWPILLSSLFLGGAALAAATAEDAGLTAEQSTTVQAAHAQLMAPCCFGGTLAEHRSPAVTELRAEVRGLVLGGATLDEVLRQISAKYGERILASPNPTGFNLLAYIVPFAAIGLVGMLFLVVWRRRLDTGERSVPQAATLDAPNIHSALDAARLARLHRELAALEP